TNTLFSSCTATGGTGGQGGDFKNTPVSLSGQAGTGQGGALAVSASAAVSVLDTTFSSGKALGGTGGKGSDNFSPSLTPPPGGRAGGTGKAGAVWAGGSSLTVTNSTFYNDSAVGGPGGAGGYSFSFNGGVGAQGPAGTSQGGGLMVTSGTATVNDCTFANNS